MKYTGLTPKQLDYLAECARGKTYKKIAEDCHVIEKTVSTSISEARKRLGAKTTLQCFSVAIAREELGIDHNGICFVPKKLI